MGPGLWAALVAAVLVALWVDRRSFPAGSSPQRPGVPPAATESTSSGFSTGELAAAVSPSVADRPIRVPDPHPVRRALASTALTFALWLGVFASLLGGEPPSAERIASLGLGPLVFVPVLMFGTALVWGILTEGGRAHRTLSRKRAASVLEASEPEVSAAEGHDTGWPAALGLTTRHPVRELTLGLGAGLAAWMAVLAVAVVTAAVFLALGLEALVPQQPASIIAGLAGLPVAWRLAISVAAGVGEEIFFRGLLQPRIGLLASTALFALGHVGYGQPFLLLGVTVLSVIYGLLARWRGNVWAAVVAHTLFDAVQLLVVIPLGIEASGEVSAFVAWGFIW